MRHTKLLILALLCIAAQGAMAQTNTDGRKVKRITFNQEQVNIEYADGTKDLAVNNVKIISEKQAAGVKAVTPAVQGTKRRWYTIDGQAMQREPRQKGIYIVRGKNGMKKTIKK